MSISGGSVRLPRSYGNFEPVTLFPKYKEFVFSEGDTVALSELVRNPVICFWHAHESSPENATKAPGWNEIFPGI